VFTFNGDAIGRLKSSLIAPSGDIYMIVEGTSYIIAKLSSTYQLQWAKYSTEFVTYDMAIALSGDENHLFFSEIDNPVVVQHISTSDGTTTSVYST
jgi:hypothetical protein